MDLPCHSGTNGDKPVQSSRSRTTKFVGAIAILAILVGVVLLHVTGVIHGH